MSATMEPLVDTVIEDPRWEGFGLAARAEAAGRAVLAELGLPAEGLAVCVMGCDDARIAGLNTEFRGRRLPTNVLSWPAEDRAAGVPGQRPALPDPGSPEAPLELGDIALSYDTCAREAAEQGKSMPDHVSHLVIHATLHLLGYDHIRDEDAALMEATEVAALARLGIADPY